MKHCHGFTVICNLLFISSVKSEMSVGHGGGIQEDTLLEVDKAHFQVIL